MSQDAQSQRPPEESRGAFVDWVTKTFDPWLESKRHSNTLIIFFSILVAIPIIGIGLVTTRTILPLDELRQVFQIPTSPSQAPIRAVFTCAQGKSITAAFSSSSVELALSDGRRLTLPQGLSASGARYTNPDGSFVFWNKGNTAFIEEGNTETYTGCVTQS